MLQQQHVCSRTSTWAAAAEGSLAKGTARSWLHAAHPQCRSIARRARPGTARAHDANTRTWRAPQTDLVRLPLPPLRFPHLQRNVLVPAILKANPLAMLGPAASTSGRVRFAPGAGQACELLQHSRPHHHGASARAEAQHRRVQAGLKSGSVRCSMRSSTAVQPVALVASVTSAAASPARAAATPRHVSSSGGSGAPRRQEPPRDEVFDNSASCGSWTVSLGLQSSML